MLAFILHTSVTDSTTAEAYFGKI